MVGKSIVGLANAAFANPMYGQMTYAIEPSGSTYSLAWYLGSVTMLLGQLATFGTMGSIPGPGIFFTNNMLPSLIIDFYNEILKIIIIMIISFGEKGFVSQNL